MLLVPMAGIAAPTKSQPSQASSVSSMKVAPAKAHSTIAYWSAQRMAAAKSPMPLLSRSTQAAPRPLNTSYRGAYTKVEGAGPNGKLIAPGAAAENAAVPQPQFPPFNRAYAYPAPFNRFETFPVSLYTLYPNRTVGKLFFTDNQGTSDPSDDQNFVCSASAVNSNSKNVVWTAGHCVSNGAGRFYVNHQFVPARRLGTNPYGVWTAKEVWTLTEWHSFGNLRQDVGALVMNKNSSGISIVNVVGGLGAIFNGSRIAHWNAMGYPQAAPFAGERQYQNQSSYAATDAVNARPGPDTTGAGNDLTGGSSGGPWIKGYTASGGYMNGVNSYKYVSPSMPLEMYSPYLGNEALLLYNTVKDRP